MDDNETSEISAPACERRFCIRYALLTVGIFLPLIWAFIGLKNVYPAAAWTVMMAGGNLQREHQYFWLRGETVSGEIVDIRAIELTDALSSARNLGLVVATVNNRVFELRSPHPENAVLLARANQRQEAGGSSGRQEIRKLPPAVRLPELLRAWGAIYNSRLPASSPQRLKAVRLDAYRWMGHQYSDYDRFIESWREEF